MKTIKKIFAAMAVLCFASGTLSAQNFLPEEEQPSVPQTVPQEPELELEAEAQAEKEAEDKTKLPPELQTLTIIESVRPHELNPQTTNYASDSQLLDGLYEGLFSFNPVTLDPQYAIAVSFSISRDKKRWQFKLRPEACFSNGEKITAHEVRHSFLQMLSTPQAPYSSLLDIIRGAQAFRLGKGSIEDVGIYAIDDETLAIYLNTPANYLPKILCHSAFSIVHRNPTVYSGAFELHDITATEYVLTKNQYYWDKDNVTLQKITFVQSDNKEENAYLFNTGAADWVKADIGNSVILDNTAIQMNAEFGTTFLYFRMKGKQKNSVWDHLEFRRAVLEAFPWNEARKTFLIPAATLVYPLTGYPPIQGFMFTDEIEAGQLMKAARQKYNISPETKIPLVLDIFENEFNAEQKKIITESLAKLGIELKIRELPSGYYYQLMGQSEADMFITSWIGDFADPLAFLELFRGDSTMNDSHWQNDEFDALLEKAATVSEEERYKLLGQAEDILMDNAMLLPLSRAVSINIIDTKEVGGWAANAFDIHPLKYLYKKRVRATVPNVVLLKN